MNNQTFSSLAPTSTGFNQTILQKKPYLKMWVNETEVKSALYHRDLTRLLDVDQGGFEHGDQSGLYHAFQNTPRFSVTRHKGWHGIFSLLLENKTFRANKNPLVLDFLAGSGTLAKRAKQIWKVNPPIVIGLDISQRMCQKAASHDETVFWGAHHVNPFRYNSADASIAAYGVHHIPYEERRAFVKSMAAVLKPTGLCILHDFNEGSPTAKFYSELIHTYRPSGHNYRHFLPSDMKNLLSLYFGEVSIRRIYDPFYLEGLPGQDETSLKKDFFSYLICLFNLKKLLPKGMSYEELVSYNKDLYWQKIEKIIDPFFTLPIDEEGVISPPAFYDELRPFNVPYASKITIIKLEDNRLALVAPRIALVGIGKQRSF